ncbi:MAG: hypothetical protein DHS20C06_05970 [Hyphobacterium sp.]|nr:MAG: hypothetical protein DHS20C06_05970 [Hyphobacterium sp.]
MPKRFAVPVLAILVVFGAYSAYWVYARGQIEAYVDNWETAQMEAGFTIEHSNVRVGGFPYRFSVSADDIVMRAPERDGGWMIEVNSFEANALPYDFTHWIISLGDTMQLEQNGAGLALMAEHARFSISGTDGITQRIGAEIDNLEIAGLGDARSTVSGLSSLRLNAVTTDDGVMAIRLHLEGVDLVASEIDPTLASSFGDYISQLRADFTISQWNALAETADLAAWSNAQGLFRLRQFQTDWGRLNLSADGEMALDGRLRPAGRLSLNLLDPEAVVDALIESGAISRENSGALRLVAQSAPRDEDGTAIPLSFRNGGIYFGPVRLGEVGSLAN